MGQLPWQAITAAGGGWLLTGVFVLALITGRLVTRREADVYIKRAETAEANVERLSGQNAELIAWAELGKSTFVALRESAGEGK